MPPLIITPWRSQQDLLIVRQQLYRLDNAQDSRRHAVDRVMAWRLRGNLPHAVESTALLIDAFLHHDITANSSFSIRAVYSAAFCRFVTGFCDIGRNRERSLEPSSMLEIARQIDMPADFVALRHEATHEELPAEHRIVAACEGALQWLWRVYWSRLDLPKAEQPIAVGSEERLESCRAYAQKMFRIYRSAKKESLKQKRSQSGLQQQLEVSTTAFAELCADKAEALRAVADEIIEKGLLLPSNRRLESPLDGAFLVWDGLLLSLCQVQLNFISCLTQSMLDAVNDERYQYGDVQKEAYTLWLSHICCSAEWVQSLGAQLDGVRHAVMKSCLMYHNQWSSRLAITLTEAGDEQFAEHWKVLLQASKLGADDAHAEKGEQPPESHAGAMEVDHVQEGFVGWHRAVLPPVTPIGVVA